MPASESLPSRKALYAELEELRNRLQEAEETLHAIRTGEVDALLVEGPDGDQVFTLRGADHGYRILVESMNEGALALQVDGTIHYANVRMSKFLNVPLEKIMGRKIQEFFPGEQNFALQDLLGKKGDRRGEFKLIANGGQEIPVLVSMSAGPEGDPLGAICVVVTDLTEQKHFLELQKAQNTELEETTAQLNDFCYSIAHDLRAPLRAQSSYAQALLEDYGPLLGEQGKGYANRIIVAAEKLDQLVQDLLSHVSLSRGDLPRETVDIAAVITHVCEDFDEQIQKSGAAVKVINAMGIVMAHEQSLNLIVANLLSNALKYCRPGIPPVITFRAEIRPGQMLRLWVEDEGIGIKTEYHERIFGVFQRLHTSDAYPGTGIGLALVRRGLERMGGSVGVESESDKGSRFWIDLPLADVSK